MSEHTINLTWQRTSADFNIKTYNRTHTIKFSGGSELQVTAAPAYMGDPEITNPEELLIAALSSCHMLTFLAIAANKGFIVDQYKDDAFGVLGKNTEGRMALTQVTLRPEITFSGSAPDAQTLAAIHDKAHVNCFIANSICFPVTIQAADK